MEGACKILSLDVGGSSGHEGGQIAGIKDAISIHT
jgi:hypothetical protein